MAIAATIWAMTSIASIATIPGREKALAEAVESLAGQVDAVYVYDGSKEGDAAKFNGHREHEADYYFCADDDLIYPAGYVEHMINKIEQYERRCVLSLAGRRFGELPTSSYYYGATERYHGLSTITEDKQVHIPGTGSLVWHRDTITFPKGVFGEKNMADVWAGIHCHRMGVPCMVVAHPFDYVRPSPHVRDHESIFEYFRKSHRVQTIAINEAFCEV